MDRVAVVGTQVDPYEVVVETGVAAVESSAVSVGSDQVGLGHLVVDLVLRVGGSHQVVDIHMDNPVVA